MSTDVLCYLLSQITPEQQMQVLRDCPGHVFQIFLHWPWQDLFLEKTDLIWNFLPAGSTYDDLLHHIRVKIRFSNYYFPELFQEFFRRNPSDFRKHFVNQDCLGWKNQNLVELCVREAYPSKEDWERLKES
ncbi:hypothetical protein AVEN_255464-1 [Araneus ventricosus]|uniref:Uncharacterized protein n=1 Tax=Araneus ventricosus TaxID=182803 RepID=A0A4Y2TVW1_ARAVE|nr:hypothetical protein AVEN_255464-1 [Araneus ventricosus]